jgi:hypothetical protein
MNQKIISLITACTACILFSPTILFAQNRTPTYGTDRRPRTCSSEVRKIKGKPTIAQAKMYFICDAEYEDINNQFLGFINDLSLKISAKPRRFNGTDLRFNHGYGGVVLNMDTDKPIYDIRASYTKYICFGSRAFKVGKNCDISYHSGNGICFKDSFDEWRCSTAADMIKSEKEVPPPTNIQ